MLRPKRKIIYYRTSIGKRFIDLVSEGISTKGFTIMALFASLIIHLFQFVFSVGTMLFSHNESAGTVFRLVFSAKRTEPKY